MEGMRTEDVSLAPVTKLFSLGASLAGQAQWRGGQPGLRESPGEASTTGLVLPPPGPKCTPKQQRPREKERKMEAKPTGPNASQETRTSAASVQIENPRLPPEPPPAPGNTQGCANRQRLRQDCHHPSRGAKVKQNTCLAGRGLAGASAWGVSS